MHFSICSFCNGKEHGSAEKQRKIRETGIELETTGPPLTEQPNRRGESKQMERNTVLTTACNRSASNVRESSFITPATLFTTPTNISSTVIASSSFNYTARNGEQTNMKFDQVKAGHFRGTYKGFEFYIVNGKLHSPGGAYNQLDIEVISDNYAQAVLAMQQGVIGIEDRLLGLMNSQLPSLDRRKLSELSLPVGSKINVNYTGGSGEKSKITFKQIQPGLFRGKYNDKEFSVANGQILTLDGADHGLNKELLITTFHRAMLGMQQTSLGLEQGVMAMEARLSGNQLNPMELLKAASPEKRILFETESLKVHNEFRQLHGVPPLTHSEYLCEIAREWAEHLALKDASYKRPNNEYGENLFYTHEGELDARKVISTWYDEINLYNYNDPQFSKDTGHFTQLVWKNTKEMGTGIAQLGDKVWVCCYYHPAGNIISQFDEQHVPRPTDVP